MTEPGAASHRRHCRLRLLGGAPLLMAAAGCTALFAPRSIDVPQARIEQWAAARLPYSMRLADVINLTVAVPRLRLLPETNRIAADVEVTLDEPLLRLAWYGSVTLRCRNWVPERSAAWVSQCHGGSATALAQPARAPDPQTVFVKLRKLRELRELQKRREPRKRQ